MKKILINWAISALAIAIAAYLLPGVSVTGIEAAFIAALVLGLMNAFIRPILIILTLPINIATLGLFTFVINAVVVQVAAGLVSGFNVDGFIWALLFSLVLSLVNMGISLFQKNDK